jgi:hypothetical protein
MVAQGMKLYGQALLTTASALRNPSTVEYFAMRAACRLLAIYEVQTLTYLTTDEPLTNKQLNDSPTSPSNWLRHVSGLVHMVQLRPPESYSLPELHDGFVEARFNAVCNPTTNKRYIN